MSDESHPAGRGPRQRGVEIGVALFMAVLALIVIFGSWKVGVGWDASGPKAGFFPFYVGLIILIASAINLYHVFAGANDGRLFATWSELRQVVSVTIPTGIYVLLVPVLGMYVSSILLIAVFMKWLGNYRWPAVLATAIGVPVLVFLVFENWFLIPLPKGPVEEWLGV